MTQEAWGHVVARLLNELPLTILEDLIDKAEILDGFYIPPAVPMGTRKVHPSSVMVKFKAGMQTNMPVRSLNLCALRWPDRSEVDQAMRLWTAEQVRMRPEVIRFGYFGSYARSDWGVGSDLDVIALVSKTAEPFERRSLEWDLASSGGNHRLFSVGMEKTKAGQHGLFQDVRS